MVEFGQSPGGEAHPQFDVPSYEEIEASIREIIEKYEGDELVAQLSDFCSLNMIEVLFEQDNKPRPLQRIRPDRLQIVRKLIHPGTNDTSADNDPAAR